MKFYMHVQSMSTLSIVDSISHGLPKCITRKFHIQIFKLNYTTDWNPVLYKCAKYVHFVNRIPFELLECNKMRRYKKLSSLSSDLQAEQRRCNQLMEKRSQNFVFCNWMSQYVDSHNNTHLFCKSIAEAAENCGQFFWKKMHSIGKIFFKSVHMFDLYLEDM